jgi:hypothetical protein
MRNLRVATAILSLAVMVALTPVSVVSQQRRPQPKPVRKATTAQAPAAVPTFDTLLGSGTYSVYVEVRGVGQVVRSNSVNELLEPVMTLSDPPKEFKTLVRWLSSRADDVMTSRMFVAAWPLQQNIPAAVVAIEFSSAEDAAKFEPQLNGFLPKIMPPTTTQETQSTNNQPAAPAKPEESTPPKPSYYLQQVGSLILITPSPLKVKDLRPAKSKLLTEDSNFRVARNRFASEQVFVYIDIDGIQTESDNRWKQLDAEEAKIVEESKTKEAATSEPANQPEIVGVKTEIGTVKKEHDEEQPPETQGVFTVTEEVKNSPVPSTPDLLGMALGSLGGAFFGAQSKFPDAVGFGLDLGNDSFEVRALMVTKPGEKCDPIPFFPILIPGGPIVPESPAILPADTELFVGLSLDFPQIYTAMSRRPQNQFGDSIRAGTTMVSDKEAGGPFVAIEKQLNIKIKEDLLPLLGSEVVVSLPLKILDDGPIPKAVVDSAAAKDTAKPETQSTNGPPIVVALSVKDKEGMRALLPRIVDSLGFKGAAALAQTERHDNVELVSYANVFSYAFIENFLVLSTDPAATRHVVDSYLKHETLASDPQFKNYTRWEPRQLQGQIYISSALMDSYKTWASQPGSQLNEQTREILSRLSVVPQPVTYSLSNDGLGTVHELHIPKNLLLMFVAGIASESNPSPLVQNERAAMTALWMIANAENQYRSGKGQGSYGTMEQLVAEELLSEDMIKDKGYKIELTIVGDKYEITAVPDEYGKTGRNSYFMDHTNILRGGDHGGSAATPDDNPIH